jgi:hypothetical protein
VDFSTITRVDLRPKQDLETLKFNPFLNKDTDLLSDPDQFTSLSYRHILISSGKYCSDYIFLHNKSPQSLVA